MLNVEKFFGSVPFYVRFGRECPLECKVCKVSDSGVDIGVLVDDRQGEVEGWDLRYECQVFSCKRCVR